ncbi:MAG: hypothetical protein ACO1PB_19125 [Ramlibacter sp.]
MLIVLFAAALAVQAQPAAQLPDPKPTADPACDVRHSTVPATDGWFKQSLSDTVVVFVHGIASNSKAAWLTGRSTCQYWPALVAADVDSVGEPAVFLGGYYSGLDSSAAGIGDVADQLFSSLSIPVGDPKLAPLDYKKIVFITHSLGGVVVRRMLVDHAAEFAHHQLSVLLYASPSNGSHYLGVVSWLLTAYKYQLLQELKANSTTLADLNVRFRNFLVQRRREGAAIEVAEFFEARFPKFECDATQWAWTKALLGESCKLVVGFLPELVPADMAGNFGASPLRIPDTDHMTIVKPSAMGDEAHRKLVLTLNQFNVAPARRTASSSLGSVQVTGTVPVGSWVVDGQPTDRMLLAGKYCAPGAAPTVQAKCNVDPYELPKREILDDGALGFIIKSTNPQPASGFSFAYEEAPIVDRDSPRFEGKPILRRLKVSAVPGPEADVNAGIIHTTTLQHLRYRLRDEPWAHPVLQLRKMGEEVVVRVPANVANARITEQGVSGAMSGRLAELQPGARLGLLVFRGKTRTATETHYRFETWSRRLGGTTTVYRDRDD